MGRRTSRDRRCCPSSCARVFSDAAEIVKSTRCGGGGPVRRAPFFIYRAVDVRRRWSCACLLVRFWRCVAPDHALCFVSVLSAYSLQASCVVVAATVGRLLLARAAAGAGRKTLGAALGRLQAKLSEKQRRSDISLVVGRERRLFAAVSGLLAALVCV